MSCVEPISLYGTLDIYVIISRVYGTLVLLIQSIDSSNNSLNATHALNLPMHIWGCGVTQHFSDKTVVVY